MRLINHWIDGREHPGSPSRLGEVYDPATGRMAAQVAFAGPREVDAAVGAAWGALEDWREVSLTRRAAVLFRFRELLERHGEELASLVVAEHGKVRPDARGELSRGAEVVEFACGIPHLLKGEFSENVSSKVDAHSIRQPVGIVAGITPFNFPVMVPLWMFPIAIACGNTFVLKPSEKDPSPANFMAELLAEAGLPDGVFNVVHGDKVAVDSLLGHPGVAAISSVGSTPVARYIYETAAANGKRVQALGGAKNHMVVLPDADIADAADAVVGAAYGSTGQRCMAVSVVVAVGDAGDRLRDLLEQRLTALRVGPGTSDESEMGPVVTDAHRDKIVSYIETGVREGAELAVDGRKVKVRGHERGFFIGPCLFDHVSPEMTIYRDEVFGPVLTLVRASSLDEAIDVVNANRYGNGTAIFTKDGGAARKYEHEVQVGMVGINVPIPVPMAFYSFGGWKDSLFGDSHVHGMEGVRFYTRQKTVTSRWPEGGGSRVNLTFPQS